MENQGRLGAYLQKLRTDRNLSLRAAAEGIGVSASRLGELEANQSRVTQRATKAGTDLLIKIARFYDQPLGTLLELAGLTVERASEPEEAELLMRFRRLPPRSRELLIALARTIEHQEQRGADQLPPGT